MRRSVMLDPNTGHCRCSESGAYAPALCSRDQARYRSVSSFSLGPAPQQKAPVTYVMFLLH